MDLNTLPTGYLFSDNYSRGELETLSIGVYGKNVNIKADFLGYTKELHGVPNTECMPLSEKWVVTLSTQYGCPQKCTFCDVPALGYHGNATFEDPDYMITLYIARDQLRNLMKPRMIELGMSVPRRFRK